MLLDEIQVQHSQNLLKYIVEEFIGKICSHYTLDDLQNKEWQAAPAMPPLDIINIMIEQFYQMNGWTNFGYRNRNLMTCTFDTHLP